MAVQRCKHLTTTAVQRCRRHRPTIEPNWLFINALQIRTTSSSEVPATLDCKLNPNGRSEVRCACQPRIIQRYQRHMTAKWTPMVAHRCNAPDNHEQFRAASGTCLHIGPKWLFKKCKHLRTTSSSEVPAAYDRVVVQKRNALYNHEQIIGANYT